MYVLNGSVTSRTAVFDALGLSGGVLPRLPTALPGLNSKGSTRLAKLYSGGN